MASSLEDELSCPVCCDMYQDPQVLPCGHSFCRICLDDHWTYSSTNFCPVCRRVSLQDPVGNLGLRNTCEAFLREKERNSSGEITCTMHGEKLLHYCETDKQALCSVCTKWSHTWHKVQPLSHVVHQRKGQIKAKLRPTEKAVRSLQNGSALEHKINNFIKSQGQWTEKQIKEEFEKLHQFLREEEIARIAALKEEKERKSGKMEEMIKGRLQSLTHGLKEVEEEMENDDVTFLQNYDYILSRVQNKPADPVLDSGSQIDVAKHLGNLKFTVWEKMKDLCPYRPVILDPNTIPHDFSVSGDMACVSLLAHRREAHNPFQKKLNRLVLGTMGYSSGFHCWDIEVGDSEHWTLGVCLGTVEKSIVRPLTPEKGFWALRRNGTSFEYLNTRMIEFRLIRNPTTLQVKLAYRFDLNNWRLQRTVSFMDVSDKSVIAQFDVPFGEELFPFLIPEEHPSSLHIAPVNVTVTVEEKFTFIERNLGLLLCCALCFFVIVISSAFRK